MPVQKDACDLSQPDDPYRMAFIMRVSCMVCGRSLPSKPTSWPLMDFLALAGHEPHSHGICPGDGPCRRFVMQGMPEEE